MSEFVCQNCLFSEILNDHMHCRVHWKWCMPTNHCEWYENVGNKDNRLGTNRDKMPEEYEKQRLEYCQKMQKMYDDTMTLSWEILLAPLPEYWFDFVKQTRKRLSGFVYKKGSKEPIGKWTIQTFEPMGSERTNNG